MGNFLRSLCMTISAALFDFIPKLYKLFYDLSVQPTLFLPETLQNLSKNIYVLMSVVMLFAFASKALAAIINPDLLFDSKKGFTSVIKRSVIALVLIIAVPFAFNYFYEFQQQIMDNSVIEKLIIGSSINDNDKNDKKIVDSAGQILASTAFSSVVYPNSDDGTCDAGNGMGIIGDAASVLSGLTKLTPSPGNIVGTFTICNVYESAVNDDITWVIMLPNIINAEKGSVKALVWNDYVLTLDWYGLLAVLVSLAIVYFLIIFCMDSALRLIKMGFLELTAPIVIMAYVFGGNDILKKWWKEVSSTGLSVFGRVAALAFMVLVLARVPEFLGENFSEDSKRLATLFMIIAALIFVKKVPEMIEKIFGIKIGGQGGISGRLGQMAGVGKIAQSAWKTIGNAGKLAAGAAIGGIGYGASKAIGAGGKAVWNKIPKGDFKNTLSNIGNGARAVGSSISAGTSAGGGIKGAKAAVKAYNESPFGISQKQRKNQEIVDRVNNTIGIDERGKVADSASSMANYEDNVNRYNGMRASAKNALNARNEANERKGKIENIEKKSTAITEKMNSAQSLVKDEATKRFISDLDYNRSHGRITTDEFKDSIKKLDEEGIIANGTANDILKDLSGIVNLTAETGLSDIVLKDNKLNMGGLKSELQFSTTAAATAQSNFDEILKSITSDDEKLAINTFATASDRIIEQNIKDISKSGVDYTTELTNNSSKENNSSEEDNSNREVKVTPTGDGNYTTSSGIIIPGSSVRSNSSDYTITTPTNNQNTSNSSNNDSNNTNTGYNPYNNSNAGTNSNSSNNNGSGSQQAQDLSGFFDGLSKDIRDASAATNSILNDQLKTQQSSLNESRKQNSTLDNISSGVNNINNTVNQMNTNIKNFSNDANKNLRDIGQKIDGNDDNSDNDND